MATVKMKRFPVTFTQEITFDVYCPEGTSGSAVKLVAENLAMKGLRDFDIPSFESYVDVGREIEVDVLVIPKNKHGYSEVTFAQLSDEDCVLSDGGDDFVHPTDAKWLREAGRDHEEDREE